MTGQDKPRARVARPDDRMTEAEAAEHIGVCLRTLQRYRADGAGPEWSRIGPRRIRYMRQDVDAWLARQKAGNSLGSTPKTR